MGLVEELERRLAEFQRAREIHCPHCDAQYHDEGGRCVTYHGEDGDVKAQCQSCEREFLVTEIVSRTYETRAVGDDDE